MNLKSFLESRRRLGPRIWWYSAAVLALGGTLLCSCLELSIGYFVDRVEHRKSMASKRARLQVVSSEVAPLSGVGRDIDDTRKLIGQFYDERFPSNYSQIVSRLGEIAIRAGVNLSNASYAQGTPGSDLSEISMEVSVGGDYARLIRFVNGVERDRTFFVVRSLSFTGQQGGDVTLHVRVSTWLRSQGAQELIASTSAPIRAEKQIAVPSGGK